MHGASEMLPSPSLESPREPRSRLTPSRKTSKVSKSSLSRIRSQESEGDSGPTSKNSLSANRIASNPDGTTQERRKPGWMGKEEAALDGGASAANNARKFTVANVGGKGKMYLRPTIRPANQRYAQPQFSFPTTPPSSAGLDALLARNEQLQDRLPEVEDGGVYTPTRSPSTPVRQSIRDQYLPSPKSATLPRAAHKRAHSYSTAGDEQFNEDTGTFKIVIERPRSSGGRPRTASQLSGESPTLSVPIPSYKLGSPRFSTRGTPFFRGSSYNGSHDGRSSIFTLKNTLHPNLPGSNSSGIISRRPSPLSKTLASDEAPPPSPSVKYLSFSISPQMYDALTFKPACDDPSLVRYSGGSITAAVPPRLISEITSPCFLDYDLLSDFFLTYRSYLSSSDLLLLLISRLQWALERNDETGMIVRVRTFVAIRHWILNYFMDEFVVDYDLRTQFCELINNLVIVITHGLIQKGNQLKIVEELKKCWRRTCALHWDSPDFGNNVPAEVPLRPGGVLGHRNADLTPSSFNGPPQLDDFFLDQESSSAYNNFLADVQRAAEFGSVSVQTLQPDYAVDISIEVGPNSPTSPESRMSLEVVSCSFPTKAMKAALSRQPRPVAYPVASSSEWDQAAPVAATPKGLTGKRVRPANAHKRNGSLSDSLRDERVRQPVESTTYQSNEFVMTVPFGGSLVRGNLFPPGKALVEVITPSTPSERSRTTTSYLHLPAHQKGPSAMSGPGMRKLIGGVRRALGTKTGATGSSTVDKLPSLGARGTTTNRLPGTAVVPRGNHSSTKATGCPLRIDLLGAGIAEDFKQAVREDVETDSNSRSSASNANSITSKEEELEANQNVPVGKPSRPSHHRAPISELTTGSKSILIVDDTVPFPTMSGALPVVSGSVETFSDAYLQPSAGPTPPLTPPPQSQTTPRRSSEILEIRRDFRSSSTGRPPSLEQDVRSPSEHEKLPMITKPLGRPSILSYWRSSKSKRSSSLRRYASFQSGFTRHTRQQRSFDATTYTEDLDDAISQSIPSLPPPTQTLRRRPGGDLRAVANVGDLQPAPLQRHRSLCSISTYEESIRSSYILRRSGDLVSMMSADLPSANIQTFSLGALAESSSPSKQPPSPSSSGSSKPAFAFEKEAAKLAQIPDDDFDDGGVESALLKLEGKYEQRRSDLSAQYSMGDMPVSPRSFEVRSFDDDSLLVEHRAEEDEKRRHRNEHIDEEVCIAATPPSLKTYQPEMLSKPSGEVLKPAVYQPSGLEEGTLSFYDQGSDPSYSSIPLLDRGLTDDTIGKRSEDDWSHRSILREPSGDLLRGALSKPESSHPSYDFVDETESIKNIVRRGRLAANGPQDPSSPQSFLASDSDDDGSDLSSEMSLEVVSDANGTTPTSPTTAENRPASFPAKSGQSKADGPRSPLICENQLLYDQRKNPLITPPISAERQDPSGHHPGRPVQDLPYTARQTSLHLPFVLAFPSTLLAQQFTLIEKDALHEIDWKELIDMRWKSVPTPALSWVSFLRTASPRGVEVVIARFNIMVKWAVSEVVLTASIEERALCISKFIHIAARCREYKNFATLYQLTVAMTSTELSRLSKTWAKVPAADVQTLKELEILVQPTRNFCALRIEMESLGIEDACIPFIGVYTQDMLWTAQRPSLIDEHPTSSNGPLINFEKCRVQAGIVKSLLRLLEASSMYSWGPVEGLTERCLWMARLSDQEIRQRVDALE